MKRLFPLLALPLLLASCEKRAALLEGMGNVKSPGGTWDVTVESAALKVTHRKTTKIEIPEGPSVTFTGGMSPGEWATTKGAFVYFDQDDRLWAYDGAGHSFICEKTRDNVSSESFKSRKGPFPAEVIKRLPESLAAEYRQ
ncbi:MAG TPA: hypothetical protein VM511_02045 [Luteolibacter sp.]|nr:hypothetical protein [Luteolibacter sp.]